MVLDDNANIYLTGKFYNTVDFDPGPGIFELTAANGSTDGFIVKLTTAGSLGWAKQIGGSGECYANSITVDSTGDIILAGSFTGNVDFDPGPGIYNVSLDLGVDEIYILKLDEAGSFIWVKTFDAIEDGNSASDVQCDSSNDIYLCGIFFYQVDFDPGPAVFLLTTYLNYGSDGFIVKLNSKGDFVWAKSAPSTAINELPTLAVDRDENIYIGGAFSGSVDFGSGLGVYSFAAPYASATFVWKLDRNANLIWVRAIYLPSPPHDGIDAICLDGAGNIYSTGEFKGPADFDPGRGIATLNSNAFDIFIWKLDDSGNFVWVKSMGAAVDDEGTSIFVDNQKNIFTTGYFGGIVDFDPEAPVYNLNSGSAGVGAFIQKLSQCSGTTYSTTNEFACRSFLFNNQVYDSTGTYLQQINNVEGCDSILTLNLTINDQPIFDSVAKMICKGQSYFAGGHEQTTAGIYRDTTVTSDGCDSVVVTTLSVEGGPANFLPRGKEACPVAPAIVSVPGYKSYFWSNGSTNETVSLPDVGFYSLTVRDSTGCTGSDTSVILSCTISGIPNAFSPNGDGLNDVFRPRFIGSLSQYQMNIYNRYGQKIFSTADYTAGWDGTFGDVKQAAGVFVYVIEYISTAGVFTQRKETVLLVR